MRKSGLENTAAPHLALIAVQILFGTWPIVGKIVLRAIPAVTLVGLRVAGASLALLVLSGVGGRLSAIKRADWSLLIISSALGLILNQLLYVKGLSLTTAINSTLLSTTIPVATLLVGIVLGNDRASVWRVFGIILAGAGVIYLIGPGRAQFTRGRFADRSQLDLLWSVPGSLEGSDEALQRGHGHHLAFHRSLRADRACRRPDRRQTFLQ